MTDPGSWWGDHWAMVTRGLLILAVGLPLIRALAALVGKAVKKRLTEQSAMLLTKAVTYGGGALLAVMFLREFGFRLTALLGAAGIAGVAIGFAAQTSLSNLISGIFLIWEKPCQVGDVLQLGDTLGVVHSIDLLSVKLRTFDNRYVRVPNEVLIKNQFTNVTHFPIRRLDIDISVAYKEDIDHVTKVLADVADKNPYSLDEPPPLILFKGFGDSALLFLFGIWFEKKDMLALRNSVMREIKQRFDAEGIEIPFPHRTLYAGSVTEPFPIRLVQEPRKDVGAGPGDAEADAPA